MTRNINPVPGWPGPGFWVKAIADKGGLMQALTVLVLLAVAGAVPGGGPSLPDIAVPPGEAVSEFSTRLAETARSTAAFQICGAALPRSGTDGSWYARQARGGSDAAPRMPAWKQAGIWGIEFTGAALGTAFAAAFGLATIEGVYQAGYNGPGAVPSSAVYFLTSAVLSATGSARPAPARGGTVIQSLEA
jgi:hypothetical protein